MGKFEIAITLTGVFALILVLELGMGIRAADVVKVLL